MRFLGKKEVTGIVDSSNRVEKLSLEELFEIAGTLGDLETGGYLNNKSAEIRVNFSGDDYIKIRSKRLATLKQNIADVIRRAYILKETIYASR